MKCVYLYFQILVDDKTGIVTTELTVNNGEIVSQTIGVGLHHTTPGKDLDALYYSLCESWDKQIKR